MLLWQGLHGKCISKHLFFFFGRHSLSNRTKKEESEAFNGSTGSGLFKPLWQTSHPLLLLHEEFFPRFSLRSWRQADHIKIKIRLRSNQVGAPGTLNKVEPLSRCVEYERSHHGAFVYTDEEGWRSREKNSSNDVICIFSQQLIWEKKMKFRKQKVQVWHDCGSKLT